MAETNIIGRTLCPWCHNDLEVVKSPKSGFHYANCTSCNSHFRNVPVAIIDMKGKEKPQPRSETGGSALERLRREVELERKSQAKLEVQESALEQLRRQKYA